MTGTMTSGRIRMAPLWRNLILAISLGAFFLSALPALFSGTGPERYVILAAALLILIIVIPGVAFSWHEVCISDTDLRLTYFPFYRRTVPLSDITDAKPITVRTSDYGLGLRFVGGIGPGVGLINRPGPAIEFTTRGTRTDIAVFADEPSRDAFLDRIQQSPSS